MEVALQVEHADVEAGWHAIYAADAAPSEAVTRMLASAHSVYSFVSSARRCDGGESFSVAPPAEAIEGTLVPRPPDGFAKHATEFLLEQLAGRSTLAAGVQQMGSFDSLRI